MATEGGQLIAHVAPKIPSFWPEDPELFFVRVEAEFVKANPKITSENTKFSYLVGALDKDHATLVRQYLLVPDTTSPYTKLKDELVRQFTPADHARLQRAKAETLGDKKPSALLCRLQQLLPSAKFKETYIRDLFLSKLPSGLQLVLAAMSEKDLRALAETADSIIDFQPQLPAETSASSEVNFLRNEVAALRSELQKKSTRINRNSNQLCWFHERFGRKARKCQAPCNWGN